MRDVLMWALACSMGSVALGLGYKPDVVAVYVAVTAIALTISRIEPKEAVCATCTGILVALLTKHFGSLSVIPLIMYLEDR